MMSKNHRLITVGLAFSAVAFAGFAVQAQGRPGSGQQARPTLSEQRRAPTEAELRTAPGVQVLEFQPAPNLSWGATQAVNAALMQGWSPVTNGATLGGASVVRLSGGHRLIVRGPDSGLYDAPIDVVNQSNPLPGSAWRSLGRTATSEPYCVPDSIIGDSRYFCGYLSGGGSAAVLMANVTSAGAGFGASWSLGGSNGGGRVTLSGAAYHGFSSSVLYTNIDMLVWDGGNRLFARSYSTTQGFVSSGLAVGLSSPEEAPPASRHGWKILAGDYPGPIGCNRDSFTPAICAQSTGSTVRIFSNPWSNESLGGALPPVFAVTPAMPSPIGTAPPEIVRTAAGSIVIVVRGGNGTIYQSRRPAGGGPFGAWVSEGGSARAGSGVSCIAVNEQPICFIQAADGRIYRKAFATASGL